MILGLIVTLVMTTAVAAGESQPSNGSFDLATDKDTAHIDFGTVGLRHNPNSDLPLANVGQGDEVAWLKIKEVLEEAKGTSAFQLVEVRRYQKGEQLVPIESAAAIGGGSAIQLRVTFDATRLGSHQSTYRLMLTDKTGHEQQLKMVVEGRVTAENFPDIPDLIYEPVTGEVTIDASRTAPLVGYSIETSGKIFQHEVEPFFVGEGHSGEVRPAALTTIADDKLGEVTMPPGESKQQSLGNIFPADMDYWALDSFAATRDAQFGAAIESLTRKPFDLVVVGHDPPATLGEGLQVNVWLVALAVAILGIALGSRWWQRREAE